LQQVQIAGARDVKGVAGGADEAAIFLYKWLSASADGAEKHSLVRV
jgi:hypothetical protein